MARRLLLVATIAALLAHVTYSQSFHREMASQPIEWFSLTSNIKVNKRLSIIAEGQFRFVRAFEPMQFQLRTAADVHVTKKLSIVPIGYVYTWNPLYGKQPARFVNNEHRVWEQVVFKHPAGLLRISHRGRLEQRYIQVHAIDNGEVVYQGFDYFANRFRYRLMMTFPFATEEMGTKAFFGSVYNEVFLSWGPKVTYYKPDQNRVFVGIGWQAARNFNITSGILYQMLVKANGAMQENNVGVQVMVNYDFDLVD